MVIKWLIILFIVSLVRLTDTTTPASPGLTCQPSAISIPLPSDRLTASSMPVPATVVSVFESMAFYYTRATRESRGIWRTLAAR